MRISRSLARVLDAAQEMRDEMDAMRARLLVERSRRIIAEEAAAWHQHRYKMFQKRVRGGAHG